MFCLYLIRIGFDGDVVELVVRVVRGSCLMLLFCVGNGSGMLMRCRSTMCSGSFGASGMLLRCTWVASVVFCVRCGIVIEMSCWC